MGKKLGKLPTEGKVEEDTIMPSIIAGLGPPMKRQDPLVVLMPPKMGGGGVALALNKKKNYVRIAGKIAVSS